MVQKYRWLASGWLTHHPTRLNPNAWGWFLFAALGQHNHWTEEVAISHSSTSSLAVTSIKFLLKSSMTSHWWVKDWCCIMPDLFASVPLGLHNKTQTRNIVFQKASVLNGNEHAQTEKNQVWATRCFGAGVCGPLTPVNLGCVLIMCYKLYSIHSKSSL